MANYRGLSLNKPLARAPMGEAMQSPAWERWFGQLRDNVHKLFSIEVDLEGAVPGGSFQDLTYRINDLNSNDILISFSLNSYPEGLIVANFRNDGGTLAVSYYNTTNDSVELAGKQAILFAFRV